MNNFAAFQKCLPCGQKELRFGTQGNPARWKTINANIRARRCIMLKYFRSVIICGGWGYETKYVRATNYTPWNVAGSDNFLSEF